MTKNSIAIIALALLTVIPANAQYNTYTWKADSLYMCGEYAKAMMEDSIAMHEGRPQKYGSQFIEDADGGMTLYRLLDPMKVDDWRKEKGMEPLADYLRKQGAQMPVDLCTKLADHYYHRGNYGQTANLLKLMPEDSLSHDAFRQLCFSYQKQGDNASFVWWASSLVARFPQDGEMVAGLITALAREGQAWKGIDYGEQFFKQDSTHFLVNRALADAYFIDRKFDKSVSLYERLLQEGDSTFNYNIANTYALLVKDEEKAKDYYQRFLDLARKEDSPNAQLLEMMKKADATLKYYEAVEEHKSK